MPFLKKVRNYTTFCDYSSLSIVVIPPLFKRHPLRDISFMDNFIFVHIHIRYSPQYSKEVIIMNKLFLSIQNNEQKEQEPLAVLGNFLSDEFLSQYEGVKVPFTELGEFVYLRTYSRFLEKEGRRETWGETIRRAINYNIGLEYRFNPGITNVDELRSEAEELYDNIYFLRQFLSGRTNWVGGTEVANLFPMSNFNCSFLVIKNTFSVFAEIFYLLMLGSGVGFRTMPYDILTLPRYRYNVELDVKPYEPIPKNKRKDDTVLNIHGATAEIVVGDSKEGWVASLNLYFELLVDKKYRHIRKITFNFDNVRLKGERLRRFGGTASGHESIKVMFQKIHLVIQEAKGKLLPIHALDIGNIIAEAVVSGGVRRSSEINLADKDDMAIDQAKNNLYHQTNDGKWEINPQIIHRSNSNNSIFYESKPTRAQLHQNFINMRYTGERGFVNAEAGRKRRSDFSGMNPCAEILLADRGLCNLVTVVMTAFIENGKLNRKKMFRAFELAARASFRMTLIKLELPEWNKQQEEDRLVGVSMTAFYDMVDALDMPKEEQALLLRELKQIVRDTVDAYAKKLGVNPPKLATTVKPEGTLSKLPTVSSGVHRSHAPYYIRRVRISAHDPLAKVAMTLGYPVFPENGQDWLTANTLVIEFPVKSSAKRTKNDVSAIEQLESYLMFQQNYVEHNTSITVSVKDHEWDEVEQWTWDHWDDIVAISFISHSDAKYDQMPEEEISEMEYWQRKKAMKPFDAALLQRFEKSETELDVGNDGCETGICPVR